MANRTSAALIAALFTLTGTAASVTAQDATTPAPAQPAAEAPASDAPAATPAAEPPAAAPAEAPVAAAPAPATQAEAKIGQPYVRSTSGDWTLRCMKTESGNDPCELFQLLKDQDNSPVAEASVIPMTGNVQAVITFIAPLETDLPAGLGLQIDAAKEARYPFMLCAQVGCISRIGLAEAELAPLKKGNKATVSVLPFGAPKEQMVRLDLSLKGFTAGMAALVEANKDQVAAPAAAPAAATPAAGAPAAEAPKQ